MNYKVVLKFTNNKVKEIESVELPTYEEAKNVAIKGKELYGATDYEIQEIDN